MYYEGVGESSRGYCSLDSYSRCSADCLFCFGCNWYQDFPLSVSRTIDTLDFFRRKSIKELLEYNPLVFGEISDPFSEHEKLYGQSLKYLKLLKNLSYSVDIFTRFSDWTKNEEYIKTLVDFKKRVRIFFGILTLDEEVSNIVETGVPNPQERVAAVKRLTDAGISVILNLTPFIPAVSKDYEDLLSSVRKVGVKELRIDPLRVKKHTSKHMRGKYKMLSVLMGEDIFKIFNEPELTDYTNLDKRIERPLLKKIGKFARKIGMSVI